MNKRSFSIPLLAASALVASGILVTASSSSSKPPESPVDKYQKTWEHRALTIQRNLGKRALLSQSSFVSTHNSYNSSVYTTAASYWDPNHKHSIQDQLRMDVRKLELDIHWYFSMEGWPWNWGNRPLLCHGQNNHTGCSTYDRHLSKGLGEINDWIRRSENRNEVVLLYLETHLDGNYGQALSEIKRHFGDLIYRPRGSCEGIPMNITKQDILNANKQILLITSGCSGHEWSQWVFSGIADKRGFPESNASGFRSYPDCGSGKFSRADYDRYLIRFYEDRTNLTDWFGGGSGKITTSNIGEMMKCGVGSAGMDQLAPTDGRLYNAVWSFDVNEPNDWGGNEDCAEQWGNGRWNDANCETRFRFACKNAGGQWFVTAAAGRWVEGPAVCSRETGGSYQFAVPRDGYDNQKLLEEKQRRGASRVWLRYSDRSREGNWTE